MSENNNPIKSVKNHWRINHLVIVQFPKIFHFCDTFLVELEVVLLQSQRNRLQHVVHYPNDEFLMITVQRARKNCQQVDVAILHLARSAKDTFEYTNNLVQCQYSTLCNNNQVLPTSCSSQWSFRMAFKTLV
jgi:hypothetical protein